MKSYQQWMEEVEMGLDRTRQMTPEENQLLSRIRPRLPKEFSHLSDPRTKSMLIQIITALSEVPEGQLKMLMRAIAKAQPEAQPEAQPPAQMTPRELYDGPPQQPQQPQPQQPQQPQ